jgi:hypothetical protein
MTPLPPMPCHPRLMVSDFSAAGKRYRAVTPGRAGTMAARHFDPCIIGTGSGNSIVDARFDQFTVALVEMARSADVLNVGRIPKDARPCGPILPPPQFRHQARADPTSAASGGEKPGADLRSNRPDGRKRPRQLPARTTSPFSMGAHASSGRGARRRGCGDDQCRLGRNCGRQPPGRSLSPGLSSVGVSHLRHDEASQAAQSMITAAGTSRLSLPTSSSIRVSVQC